VLRIIAGLPAMIFLTPALLGVAPTLGPLAARGTVALMIGAAISRAG
jgi:hypothetical protein